MKINGSAFLAAVSVFILSAGCGSAFAAGPALEQLLEATAGAPAVYEDPVVRGGPMAELTTGPAAEIVSAAPSPPAAAADKPALSRSVKGTVPAPETGQKSTEGAAAGLLIMSPLIALGLIILAVTLVPASAVLIPLVVYGAGVGIIIAGITSWVSSRNN